ncbi:MAG TPA: GlxA family transcriptional regulator, partial [Inquilinus sp.]|nr:GlxA family transcriptional regulator [Inquilinus sp.]
MNGPRRIAILVLDGFSNLTLAALIEPLRAANRMAGRPLFAWSVLSEGGGPIASSSNLRLEADAAMGAAGETDDLFVVASY